MSGGLERRTTETLKKGCRNTAAKISIIGQRGHRGEHVAKGGK